MPPQKFTLHGKKCLLSPRVYGNVRSPHPWGPMMDHEWTAKIWQARGIVYWCSLEASFAHVCTERPSSSMRPGSMWVRGEKSSAEDPRENPWLGRPVSRQLRSSSNSWPPWQPGQIVQCWVTGWHAWLGYEWFLGIHLWEHHRGYYGGTGTIHKAACSLLPLLWPARFL